MTGLNIAEKWVGDDSFLLSFSPIVTRPQNSSHPLTLNGAISAALLRYEVVANGNDWTDASKLLKEDGMWSIEDWNSELHRRLAEAIPNKHFVISLQGARRYAVVDVRTRQIRFR